MARNKGIIKPDGKLDNLSFYKRLGKDLVRKPGSPTAAQIRTKQSCQRTRENLDEFFQGAVKAACALRKSLSGMKHLWHPDVSGHLNKVFRQMIQLSEGTRGQRPIQVRKHKELLKNFSFYPERSLHGIASMPYTLQANETRTEVYLTVPPFNGAQHIKAPQGATHFRLLLAATVASEYVFSNPSSPYLPLDKASDGCNAFSHSTYIKVDGPSVSFSLEALLPPFVAPLESSAVVAAIGIEFYQQIGDIFYLLKQQGFMKVAEVF